LTEYSGPQEGRSSTSPSLGEASLSSKSSKSSTTPVSLESIGGTNWSVGGGKNWGSLPEPRSPVTPPPPLRTNLLALPVLAGAIPPGSPVTPEEGVTDNPIGLTGRGTVYSPRGNSTWHDSPITPPEGETNQAISGADSPITPPGGLLPNDTVPRRPAAASVPRNSITLPEGETPRAIPGADSPITPPEGLLQHDTVPQRNATGSVFHFSGYHHTKDPQSHVPGPHLHNEKVGPSSTRPTDPPRGQGDSTIHRAAPDSSGTRGCPREEEGATATTVAVSEPKSVFGPPLGMTQSFLHKPVTKWAEYPQSTQGKALRAPFETIDDVLRARTRDERTLLGGPHMQLNSPPGSRRRRGIE
jgi:hypothetical protein